MRLRFRELVPGDASFAFALNSDPEVIRFTGDSPFDSEEAARSFLEGYRDYRLNGYGRWGVELLNTGELIGWCGLKYHPDTGDTDLGYRFFRRHWNQGYATESALSCLAWGFGERQLMEIIARAHRDNRASVRVLEKLRFDYLRMVEEDGEPWNVYRMSARFFTSGGNAPL